MKISRIALAVASSLVLSSLAIPTVSAARTVEDTTLPVPTTVSSDDGSTTNKSQEWRAAAEKRIAEAKEKADAIKAEAKERQAQRQQVGEKLSAAKQKVCQTRQTVIGNVMTRINDRGQRRLDLINAISTKVQDFKSTKNLTVADYDTLVSAVETSKATAQTAVDAVKNTQVEFKCDGNDPKGVGSAYQAAVKVQNDALKAYRDAVKDLVAAIKPTVDTGRQGDN